MNHREYGQMRALEDRYWWFVSRRRMARHLIRLHHPKCTNLLDLGAGTGAFLAELPEGISGVGIDFSPEAIRLAAERDLPDLVVADGAKIPLAQCEFDAVVALDTLEHIERHDWVASEVFRCLKPGGVFVVNVPAYRWLWGPHDEALHHFRRYVRRDLRRVLEGAGFRVERLSYSIFLLFPVVLLIRLLDRCRKGPAKVRLPKVGFLNGFLVKLQDFELQWMCRRSLPWGSSVVAVGRKPADS